MTRSRTRLPGLVALLLAGSLAVAACSSGDGAQSHPSSATSGASSSATEGCDAPVARVVDATQRYVDRYGSSANMATATPFGPGIPASAPPSDTLTESGLQSVIDGVQQELAGGGCQAAQFQQRLAARLTDLHADGAVAQAVLLQVVASLTGALADTPGTRAVTPSDDLPRILAEIAPDSTLTLAAGTYSLDQTVVLLRGVTLKGAGAGRTVVTSTASENALLVLTDGRVALEDLSLRRVGKATGSVLTGGPAASLVLTRVEVAGGQAGKPGEGGAGVLMSATAAEAKDRGTTLEVTDSTFARNQAAGIAITGTHRASIVGSTFRRNGECGVCFLDGSGGAVRNSTFDNNATGVAATSTAAPLVQRNRFNGGQVAVQVGGRATPELDGNRISGAARAAVIFADRSAGRVNGTTCVRVPFGIVVAKTATPFLGKNSCRVATTK
jgi:parallel beta-helix repeat protein